MYAFGLRVQVVSCSCFNLPEYAEWEEVAMGLQIYISPVLDY